MQMRFTIYAFGREVEGKWLPYTPESFAFMCNAYAENRMMFTCEFEESK